MRENWSKPSASFAVTTVPIMCKCISAPFSCKSVIPLATSPKCWYILACLGQQVTVPLMTLPQQEGWCSEAQHTVKSTHTTHCYLLLHEASQTLAKPWYHSEHQSTNKWGHGWGGTLWPAEPHMNVRDYCTVLQKENSDSLMVVVIWILANRSLLHYKKCILGQGCLHRFMFSDKTQK